MRYLAITQAVEHQEDTGELRTVYLQGQFVWLDEDSARPLLAANQATDVTPPFMQVRISQPHDLYVPGQLVWVDETTAKQLIDRQVGMRHVGEPPLVPVTFLRETGVYNAGETAGFALAQAKAFVAAGQAFYAGPPVAHVGFVANHDIYLEGEEAWLQDTVATQYVEAGIATRLDPTTLLPVALDAAPPAPPPPAASPVPAEAAPAAPAPPHEDDPGASVASTPEER